MNSSSQAYISGTTLAQFVSTAYACTSGCKHVYRLYGIRQSAREMTDKPEAAEKSEVVIVSAAPVNSDVASPDLSKLGYLVFCQAPVHKLSYADTKRIKAGPKADSRNSVFFFHFTKVIGSDEIVRVFYTLYECIDSRLSNLRPFKLNIDNLVDSLQNFTKISSIFARNTFSGFPTISPPSVDVVKAREDVETESFSDLEVLVKEKAMLVKRIAELTEMLQTQAAP